MSKSTQCPAGGSTVPGDRRSGKDRRKSRFRILKPFSLARRRHLRRSSDRYGIHLLDHYNSRILVMVTLVLMLSALDALLTLWLLDSGASELNPVMAYFLQFGPLVFMTIKYLITAMAVIIVVVLYHTRSRHTSFQLGHLLYYFAAGFGAVVLWELSLLKIFSL